MKNDLREVLDKYNINSSKITIRGNTRIIDDRLVFKPRVNNDIMKTYDYLKSRAFDYFPYPVEINKSFEIYPFIEDIHEPIEQKAQDLMYLISLLHSKTTFYKEIDIDKIKEIYESMIEKINYLDNYYNNIIDNIEREVYMSPSSYLIARNINIIFSSIYYVKDSIEKWYKLVQDNKNMRNVLIHGNINLDHYLKSDKPYLISFNKSRIDSPIFDLLSFYKNHYLNIDFNDLFKYYEIKYPLKEEERLLLFSYMAIPPVIEDSGNEYNMCIKINKIIDYLYKTSNLIMNYQK